MKTKEENVISNKTIEFALRIIRCYKILQEERHEYVMAKQILKSGTSIGANVREGMFAQSHPDFISKMSIALKEAEETDYWLYLLKSSDYIEEKEYISMYNDLHLIIKLLVTIIKTAKSKSKQ